MTRIAAPRPAQAPGWGISLRYRGRTLKDLRLRGDRPLRAGEAPECELVVPGLGGAAVLARGAVLARVPGLGGVVRRGGQLLSYESEPALTLAPGDHATLTLDAHPEITLELRREEFERLPLGTLIHVRELARQLALGAGLLAGLVLLVRQEVPVNVLEVKGEPDAPPDTALVRAMYVAAAEAPRVDMRLEFQRFDPPPPEPVVIPPEPVVILPEPAALAEPEPEVAPMPLVLAAEEAVPVPVAEVDAQPKRGRRRARDREPARVMGLLGGIDTDVSDIFGVAGGVPGGVIGGVGNDVLAELRADAPPQALLALRARGDLEEVVERKEEVVGDDVADLAIPGLIDTGAATEFKPGVAPVEVVEAVEPAAPPRPGTDSHTQAGVAVVRGVVGGVAAVVPAARCEDPSLTPRRQLDVVFVIDVSTTMAFMLDRIERELANVDAEARAQGLDARYGLVVFVDDVELGNAGQPYADLAALQRDLARWRLFTASNRQIGSEASNLDWPENTLDALHTAATGFAWRPADTTLRMVVHATDDDFGEAPAIQSGQAVQRSYQETIAALRGAEVRMFSFAARVGGQCECLDVRPGLFTRFRGRASLPDATGGAVFDIDEVAGGKLSFVAAVAGAIKSGVCTRYPLSPFGGPR